MGAYWMHGFLRHVWTSKVLFCRNLYGGDCESMNLLDLS